MLIGAIVGGILGGILGAMGTSITTVQYIVAPIGFVIGLAVCIIPLKLILGRDFGEFRLVLVKNEQE